MKFVDVGLDGLKVLLAIPGGRQPEWETAMALSSTLLRCQKHNVPCAPLIVKGCQIVTKARDELVDGFLRSDANRLFWVDSDMDWTPEDFLRLLALSKLVDVVGAAYPAKTEPPTFYVKMRDMQHIETNDYGLMDAEGLGLGFTVMRREVVEAVAAGKPTMRDQMSGREMKSVFRTDIHEGNFRGEDMAFFADIRDAGYKVWIDPQTNLGHVGLKKYQGAVMDALRIKEGTA